MVYNWSNQDFFWFVVKLCKGVKNQNYFIVLCTFWSKAKIWTCLIKNAFKIFNALVVFYWLLESKSIWRTSAFVEWKRNQGLMRALNLHSPSLHFGLETVVVYASTKSEYTNAFCFNHLSLCVVPNACAHGHVHFCAHACLINSFQSACKNPPS